MNKSLPSSKTCAMAAILLSLSACGGGGTTSSSAGVAPSVSSAAGYAIEWDEVNDNNVTGYRIYYSTVPFSQGATPGRIDVSGSGNNRYDFLPGSYGIAQGTTVYVVVSSIGPGGMESPTSSVSSIIVE